MIDDQDMWDKQFEATCLFAIQDVKRWSDEHPGYWPTITQMVQDLHFTPEFARKFVVYAYEQGWIRDE